MEFCYFVEPPKLKYIILHGAADVIAWCASVPRHSAGKTRLYKDTSEERPHASVKTSSPYLRGLSKFSCFHHRFRFAAFRFCAIQPRVAARRPLLEVEKTVAGLLHLLVIFFNSSTRTKQVAEEGKKSGGGERMSGEQEKINE